MLASDFFLLAHDDVTGRALVAERAVALGLAAGLLGELLRGGYVVLRPGGLVVAASGGVPREYASAAVFGEVCAEPTARPVSDWLAYLAGSSRVRVGRRLESAGLVAGQRRRLGGGVRFVPVAWTRAASPGAVLVYKLRMGHVLEAAESDLAGLAYATGLDEVLLVGDAAAARPRLAWCASRMWTPMRELVQHTHAAAGNAVLTRR